jgi:hypothetical protein
VGDRALIDWEKARKRGALGPDSIIEPGSYTYCWLDQYTKPTNEPQNGAPEMSFDSTAVTELGSVLI